MPPKRKKIVKKTTPPKTPGKKPEKVIEYSYLERVLNAKLPKKGTEPVIFPLALAQLLITPERAEKLIAWQVKRMRFKPERIQQITKELIHVYHRERKWVLEKKRRG